LPIFSIARFEIKSLNYYGERKDLNLYSLTDEFHLRTDIGNKNLWVVLAAHGGTKKRRISSKLLDRGM